MKTVSWFEQPLTTIQVASTLSSHSLHASLKQYSKLLGSHALTSILFILVIGSPNNEPCTNSIYCIHQIVSIALIVPWFSVLNSISTVKTSHASFTRERLAQCENWENSNPLHDKFIQLLSAHIHIYRKHPSTNKQSFYGVAARELCQLLSYTTTFEWKVRWESSNHLTNFTIKRSSPSHLSSNLLAVDVRMSLQCSCMPTLRKQTEQITKVVKLHFNCLSPRSHGSDVKL